MATKAKLVPINWDSNQRNATPVPNRRPVFVHFNPESLKLQFANENRGGNQPGGNGQQNVASATSKLSVELLFDTTHNGDDVRRITKDVAAFVAPMPEADSGGGGNNNRIPPGISFEWGTIIFRGVVSSMDETLDYFSEEGVPLRATVSLVIARQSLEYLFGPSPEKPAAQAAGRPPGTTPLQTPNPGDNLQSMAGRTGRSRDWKAIAAANNVDDPLRLTASAQLNMNVSANFSAGASAGASASAGFGASASAGANASAGFGASGSAGMDFSGAAGFSAGASAGIGAGASAGIGASASAGFGASASAGFGASASAGFGASASAGIGGSASAGFGAGASAGIGGSASAGFGAGASAGFGAGASAGFGASTEANASLGIFPDIE